ncbi:MAG: NADH-quinone oxidoreductase subunit L [Planctomycetes bacterium]|nr:NADH-quinone oxidoreductase subunit L [Planctomycetota bacterium]
MPTEALLAVVICAMPLLSACILAVTRKTLLHKAHFVGVPLMLVSLACAVVLALHPHEVTKWDFEWMNLGGVSWRLGIEIDGLTRAMLIVVTVVSTLVHLFSSGYMKGDDRYSDFFRWLGFFTFSMLGLVVSDNLLTLFVFWETMGLSSYKLIGHYFQKESAYLACKKAFMTTRVGDAGMFLALLALFFFTGSLQFDDVFAKAAAGAIPAAAILWISLGLFMGAAGKSAQFPLHIWLPDAMEGPTPVSALIHAATMVAAGVYLIGRMMTLIAMSPEALVVISCVGGFTAIFAAAIAFTATDIKKVLAYSTISQLGFMFTALGVGSDIAWQAGLFHLVTHAFFKACLFLGSGSVIHACHHEQDMTRMGGLWKKIPVTGATYGFACLAIAGLPFITSGFWSKDQILMGMLLGNGGPYDGVYRMLFYVLALTATMTAFYMFRSFWLTFFTKPRDHHVHDHAHESPISMTLALVVLAGLALVDGVTNALSDGQGWQTAFLPNHGDHALARFAKTWGHEGDQVHHAHSTAVVFSMIACFGGIGLSAFAYLTSAGERVRKAARAQIQPLYDAAKRKFFMDDIAEAVVIQPTKFLGELLYQADAKGVDGIVDGVGAAARITGTVSAVADDKVVDGAVHAAAGIPSGGGRLFNRAQTGRMRNYLFGAVGAIGLFAVIVLYMRRG